MPKVPPKARMELINGVLDAFHHSHRMLMMGHLFEAGSAGLRTSELGRALDITPDLARKHLKILQQALLINNEVGRDEKGVFSRYVITEYGEEWFDKLGLKEGNRAIPLMA